MYVFQCVHLLFLVKEIPVVHLLWCPSHIPQKGIQQATGDLVIHPFPSKFSRTSVLIATTNPIQPFSFDVFMGPSSENNISYIYIYIYIYVCDLFFIGFLFCFLPSLIFIQNHATQSCCPFNHPCSTLVVLLLYCFIMQDISIPLIFSTPSVCFT